MTEIEVRIYTDGELLYVWEFQAAVSVVYEEVKQMLEDNEWRN